MAELFTVGGLSRLREICRKNGERFHFRLRVVDVLRYLKDKSFPISTTADSTDVFDLILTDGSSKTTCVLSPIFNNLVYTYHLRKNTLLLVKDYRSYVDDRNFEAQLVVIIEGLEILGNENEDTADVCKLNVKLPFCINSSAREKNGFPVTTSRGCYLPLWNDEDFVGSVWNNSEMETKLKTRNRIGGIKVVSIRDLDSFGASMRRPYPALIARVVGKSKISYFGKAENENYKFPLVATLMIEDRTCTVAMCLWNSMCVNYYKHIGVGDVLHIAGYRIVRKYQPKNNTVYTTKESATIELSLNPSNPTGEIYKLSSDDLNLNLDVPEVPYRFIDSGALSQCPQGLICDVAGVVTYVSCVVREKKQSGNGSWMYKWLHLKDGSSVFPIIIKLYACSQPEVVESIAVGCVLVCARMLLKVVVTHRETARHVFLTTTRDSQVYSLCKPGELKGKPFCKSTFVHSVIEFRKSDEAKALLRTSCCGGIYDYPPLPRNFIAYRDEFPNNSLQLVSMESIPTLLNDLHYMQRLRLPFQGFVVAMEFIPIETEEVEDSDTELHSIEESSTECKSSQTEASSSQVRTRSQKRKEQILKETSNHVCTRSMAKRRKQNENNKEIGKAVPEKNKAHDKKTSVEKGSQYKPNTHNSGKKHFPYRVLDNNWKENSGSFLTLGLATAHVKTLPTSPENSDIVFVQTTDGTQFVEALGYWRFLIMGLNRQTVLSVVFFPDHEDPKDLKSRKELSIAPFMHMLNSGGVLAGFGVQDLLSCGERELKDRCSLFVVDVYCHGAGDFQAVLMRAF